MVRALAAAGMGAAGETGLGPLPEWDLDDLYPGRDSPELARDLADLASRAKSFRERHDRPVDGLPRGPCRRNQPFPELCASTRSLCLTIQPSASASVAKGLTVVGLLSGMLTSTPKDPPGSEMTR